MAGIDIGGTKTCGLLYSPQRGVLISRTIASWRLMSPDDAARAVDRVVHGLLDDAGLSASQLLAVGIGLPGLISPERTFLDSIILPTWKDVDFGTVATAVLGVPTLVDNDATMAALGHYYSTPEGQRPGTLLCFTLGTGVGGSILMDGVPMRGPDGTAGQLGHIIVKPAGDTCECGLHGCVNAYASGTAITRRYNILRRSAEPAIDGREVAAAMLRGEPQAVKVFAEAESAIAIAIRSLINILNPDEIALGGGVAQLGMPFLTRIQQRIGSAGFSQPTQRARLTQVAHGTLAGAYGSALASLQVHLAGQQGAAV